MRTYLAHLSTVSLFLVGCTATLDPSTGPVMSKDEARAASKTDHGVDFCDLFGWYADGVCDDFCALPDPDCDDHFCARVLCAPGTRCDEALNACIPECPLTGIACDPTCGESGRLPGGAPCRRGNFNEATCSCDPVDPPADCYALDDEAACSAAPECVVIPKGCAPSPGQRNGACVPADYAACTADSECGEGLTCQSVHTNPCAGSMCLACGADTGLCLPAPAARECASDADCDADESCEPPLCLMMCPVEDPDCCGPSRCVERPAPPADCRSEGCDEGRECQYCWGHFACIPEGALC